MQVTPRQTTGSSYRQNEPSRLQERIEPSLYETIVESSDDAIVSVSTRGLVTSWNPAAERLYGYTRDEVLGEPIETIAGAELADVVARALSGESIVDLEATHRGADGRPLDVSITASAIRDEQARIGGVCLIHRDIGGRREARERTQRLTAELEQRVRARTADLEVANRDLREYAYTVAHDLRTPLRAIAGFAALLGDGHSQRLDDEGRRMLDVIRRNAEEVARLIDSFVSLARFDATARTEVVIDVNRMVQSCVAELAAERRGRGVEIVMGDLPQCHGDPALLRQVWLALLSNAQKFTRAREPGRIEIGGESTAEGASYFVRDNGVGFDMANAERIFAIFQRAHRPDDYEGIGVGLALASRIVERHGGRMWADSAPDRGATFRFTIGAR